jgi:hypothetical protein
VKDLRNTIHRNLLASTLLFFAVACWRPKEPTYPPFVALTSTGQPALAGSYSLFRPMDDHFILYGPAYPSVTLSASNEYTYARRGCWFDASASGKLSISGDQLNLQDPDKLEGDDGLTVPGIFYLRTFGDRNILLDAEQVAAYDLFPSPLIGLVQTGTTKMNVAKKSVHAAMKKHFGASYPPDTFSVVLTDPTREGAFLHAEISMAPYKLHGFVCRDASQKRTCSGGPSLKGYAASFSSPVRWVELLQLWSEPKSPSCQTDAAPKRSMEITWPKHSLSIPLPEGTHEDWAKHCDPKVRLAAFFLWIHFFDSL